MLSLFQSSMRRPKGIFYGGADKDEEIVFVFRKSLLVNVPWVTAFVIFLYVPGYLAPYLFESSLLSDDFVGVLGLFWYLFLFGFFFQNFINWFFNNYIVTSKKVVDVDFKGLFYANISEATLDDVEDVTSNISGAIRLIFNFGTVFIQTAGETREFEFTDVPNPAKVRDLIADLVEKHNHSKDD